MIVFLTAFVFSATLQPVSHTDSLIPQRDRVLSASFVNKKNLLDECYRSIGPDELRLIMHHFQRLISDYPEVDECDTLSMAHLTSRKFEFFCALCCVGKDKLQDFLNKFSDFYQAISTKTEQSASFLMLCAAIEDDPIKALELIQIVINNIQFLDAAVFPAQFIEEHHGLPYTFNLIQTEENKDAVFLIGRLRELASTRAAQSDLAE